MNIGRRISVIGDHDDDSRLLKQRSKEWTSFSQYTDIESLLCILKNRELKANCIKNVDDLKEQSYLQPLIDNGEALPYVSCFDYSEDENIPLWNMYSGDKYGVWIQFVIPRSSFSFHSIIIDTTRYAKAYRHGADCINFYLMNINDAKMPYPNVWIHTSTKPIVYKNDLAISSYQLPANNLYNLSTVASVKSDSWAFQHEVRIVADFQYSASAFEEKQPIVELPDFEYILIPISFSRLEKITITFSPWMQEQTKRMVSESIEKLELNCECTVQSSRFDKLIRRK